MLQQCSVILCDGVTQGEGLSLSFSCLSFISLSKQLNIIKVDEVKSV